MRVIARDKLGPVRFVAGIDVGYKDNGATAQTAVAVLTFPDLELRENAVARRSTRFPYVPGLLSFRELPSALDTLQELRRPPDLLICDGHGLAHPRRFGLACHIGILSGIPSIGVGKELWVGRHDPLSDQPGPPSNTFYAAHRDIACPETTRQAQHIASAHFSAGAP